MMTEEHMTINLGAHCSKGSGRLVDFNDSIYYSECNTDPLAMQETEILSDECLRKTKDVELICDGCHQVPGGFSKTIRYKK